MLSFAHAAPRVPSLRSIALSMTCACGGGSSAVIAPASPSAVPHAVVTDSAVKTCPRAPEQRPSDCQAIATTADSKSDPDIRSATLALWRSPGKLAGEIRGCRPRPVHAHRGNRVAGELRDRCVDSSRCSCKETLGFESYGTLRGSRLTDRSWRRRCSCPRCNRRRARNTLQRSRPSWRSRGARMWSRTTFGRSCTRIGKATAFGRHPRRRRRCVRCSVGLAGLSCCTPRCACQRARGRDTCRRHQLPAMTP